MSLENITPNTHIIVQGDFNEIQDIYLDYEPGKNLYEPPKARKNHTKTDLSKYLIKRCNLVDITRLLLPDTFLSSHEVSMVTSLQNQELILLLLVKI